MHSEELADVARIYPDRAAGHGHRCSHGNDAGQDAFHSIGLGCLDRIAGGSFGFLQGVLLVTLGILVTVAFFPQAHWLADARLPRYFFGPAT